METKIKKQTENKIDLMSKLNQMNLSASVSHAIKNKYVYPNDLKELKSTDKQKKSYRRKIQKTLLVYLSLEKPNKEEKEAFEIFCKTFITNFKSLKECNIDNIYSFHNTKEKENAIKILNLYNTVK